MKKLILLILIICITSIFAIGQHAFIPEYQFGSFDKIDLLNAAKTNVATTSYKIPASDFGPGGLLYAIDYLSNGFFIIDTITGAGTLVAPIIPPTDHIWSGMAYDEEAEIMYGISYHDVTYEFYSSLYIIDVTDGSYTFLGSQTSAPSIAAIGIDGEGDMYAMQLGNPAKLYKLDKTNGQVIGYQGEIGHMAAGPAHGMDWCPQTQEMYLTSDVHLGLENNLQIIDVTDASTTVIGALGIANWIGTIAVAPILKAKFTASTTDLCVGGVVDFTDESDWATSWEWTFEGGTPATSTEQNPSITYNTTGIYDVTLEVSNGVIFNTLFEEDMIIVRDIPVQPDMPQGTINACGNEDYTYTTQDVQWATSYLWEVLPADAGIITGIGISALFEASDSWTGDYTIKVQASNLCGNSSWSSELNCVLAFAPQPYLVQGGGSYCEGGLGREVTLELSQTDVDYELFLDDVSTGGTISGTGNSLSFGFKTDEGIYTIIGYSVSCTKEMNGEAYIYMIYSPGAASQPTGPTEVCPNSITDYQTDAVADADTINWVLNPANAGTFIGSGENISIDWTEEYTGIAHLSVYGSNDCGDGDASAVLEINVNQLPEPVVIGETTVCEDEEYIYATVDNLGSTYDWSADGGLILSGSGTSEVIISWTNVGTGSVFVTEISSNTCEATSDSLYVLIDDCTFVDEVIANGMSIFPNPTNQTVNIEFSGNKSVDYDLTIYNQMGQQVFQSDVESKDVDGLFQINVSSLSGGLYFVKITTASKISIQSRFEIVR